MVVHLFKSNCLIHTVGTEGDQGSTRPDTDWHTTHGTDRDPNRDRDRFPDDRDRIPGTRYPMPGMPPRYPYDRYPPGMGAPTGMIPRPDYGKSKIDY